MAAFLQTVTIVSFLFLLAFSDLSVNSSQRALDESTFSLRCVVIPQF